MKITKRQLRMLIEQALNETGTDPKGIRKDLSGEKTDPRINPNNPEEVQAAIDDADASNLSDLHIGQFGAQRGDPGRRKISFGPRAETNPNPSDSDITTIQVGYPDDPTPNQAKHGQEYMLNYHGLGDEDNMYSVGDTRTQSFSMSDDYDDVTEEDPEKTDPSMTFEDEDTPEVGITLRHDRFEGEDPDDFDLSISDIDRDFGSFEDDEDTDEEEEEIGLLQRIKSGFKNIQKKYF